MLHETVAKFNGESKTKNCIHKSLNLFLHLSTVQNVSLALTEGKFLTTPELTCL